MTKTTDWLPPGRDAILSMAQDWRVVAAAKATAWNIPADVLKILGALVDAAALALATSRNETTRTPVTTAQCREAFTALTTQMRDTKRRYFLTPPLADSDYIALGLKPHDNKPTPSGPPTAQVIVETTLLGRHELGLKIIYITGVPTDPANKGYRIWYTLLPQDAPPPASPEDLHKSFYTRRHKDRIEFDFGDSGKTAYFAVQIENDGKKGPWGPIVSALIP
ncbi:MAG: hypothetical protein LBE06_05395 [Azoarcus sp.]|nr:hypothetical protein [Azoarcus sp.]